MKWQAKQIGLFILILIISFIIIFSIGRINAWPCTSSCNPDFNKCRIDGTVIDIKCEIDYKGIPDNLEGAYMFFYLFGLPLLSSIIIFLLLYKKIRD
jgi:hypothetical protein